MARYFDTANPIFRTQVLAILMLLLLAFALMAACGTMAYRRQLQGPWYKNLVPNGAGPAHWSAAATLPSNAATFTWHDRRHVHRIWMTFFKISRSTLVGEHSNVQASPFVTRLFPASHGWIKPRMTMEKILGVPMLLWQSYRHSTGHAPATRTAQRVMAFRYVLMKASGGGRLETLIFGANHAPRRVDNAIFLQMVDRMAVGEP